MLKLGKNSSKKVISFLLFFTPISILIYAIVSYVFFFKFQKKNNNIIIQHYSQSVLDENKKSLLYQLKFYDNTYKFHRQNIANMVKSLKPSANNKVALFDKKNKLIYTSCKSKEIIKIVKLNLNKKGILMLDNIILVSKHIGPNHYKIAIFKSKSTYANRVNKLREELQKNIHNAVTKSMIWLSISWLFFTILSTYIAYKIYNQIKEYEHKLKVSNNKIVFQSRQAMLGELLPMIAHQWRQPINGIASVLMRMRFDIEKPNVNTEVLDRHCQVIEDSVELMSNTIEDFRGFYRPKDEPEFVEVSAVVRKSIYFLHELLDKKNIFIKQNLSTCYIKIFANELMQVTINLIKNAYDVLEDNGEINITVQEFEKTIVVRVEDNGPGIPEDVINNIFEPHFSTKEGSMGLGLYMSKLIVETHFNGTIEAYNKKGKGAGFEIVLNRNL